MRGLLLVARALHRSDGLLCVQWEKSLEPRSSCLSETRAHNGPRVAPCPSVCLSASNSTQDNVPRSVLCGTLCAVSCLEKRLHDQRSLGKTTPCSVPSKIHNGYQSV